MKKILIAVFAGMSLSGCVAGAIGGLAGMAIENNKSLGWEPRPFDESEYQALRKTGTGTIRGQVFAKTRGGDVKKGAGNIVRLIPATQFGNQWFTEAYVKQKQARFAPDSRYAAYEIEKITDGDGRFEFKDVPQGTYYVHSTITWETVSSNPYMRRLNLLDTQGGDVVKLVTVLDEKTTEVMLTR